jgi:hypothetical protein
VIDVGQLTKQVVMALGESSGQLFGDGIAPEGGGWLSGQPNVSAFVPYGVLLFQGATLSDPALRYNEQIRSWSTNWRVSSFGGSREQCDWMATLAREGLDDCLGQQFGAYTVTMATWGSLGAMTRNDGIDPPMWSVTDTFSLRCDA